MAWQEVEVRGLASGEERPSAPLDDAVQACPDLQLSAADPALKLLRALNIGGYWNFPCNACAFPVL